MDKSNGNNLFMPASKYKWLTKLYDSVLKYLMPEVQFRLFLIYQAGIKKDHRVLDFGIGTETLSILVKSKYSNISISGVDTDQKILDIARKKVERVKKEIYIDKYDGVVLPYPDETFDRVISCLVFHHLDDEQKTNSFKEIRRVLKRGGELHIADWGEASNIVMRCAFYFIQIIDGFKTTRDNIKGRLPAYLVDTGFIDVQRTDHFDTLFGTIRLMKAKKF